MAKVTIETGPNVKVHPFKDAMEEAARRSVNDACDSLGRSLKPWSGTIFFDGGPWPSPTRSDIPPLDVPELPEEPSPDVTVESASVQMLRRLEDDRRKELARAERAREEDLAEIKRLERDLADRRRDVAQSDLHIAAANASIAEVQADIPALGGR